MTGLIACSGSAGLHISRGSGRFDNVQTAFGFTEPRPPASTRLFIGTDRACAMSAANAWITAIME